MPQVPEFDPNETLPIGVDTGGHADPGAFAAVGEALGHAGMELTDTANRFGEHYLQARMQADVTNAVAGATRQASDLAEKWSRVPDRAAAMKGYSDDIATLREQTLDGMSPMATAMVGQRFDEYSLSLGIETGKQAFAREASKYRGDLDTNLAGYAQQAAQAPNDMARAMVTDNAVGAIDSAAKAGWILPEDAADRKLKFHSDVASVNVRQDMNADPATAAAKLADPSAYPGLLPQARETFQYRADLRAERQQNQAIAAQAHADAMAERQYRQTQATNEATILGRVYAQDPNHPPPSAGDLSDMAAHGLISAGGLDTIHGALIRGAEGNDYSPVAIDLYDKLGKGQLSSADIHDASAKGYLSTKTAINLMEGMNSREKSGDNSVERGVFATLKTALSGDAVEKGEFNFGNDKAPYVANWAQAQGEWTQRVLINREDPQAVLADMLPRYQSAQAAAPTWLPAPRLGAIGNADQLSDIGVRTYQAHQAGQIDDATYQGQVQLLNQYKAFYDRREKALSVTAPKPQQPQPAKQTSEGG